MEQTKKKSSSFVAFYLSVVLLCLLAAVLLLPDKLVVKNFNKEVEAISFWLGTEEFSYSRTLLEQFVPAAYDGMKAWFRIGTETYTNGYLMNMANWLAVRLYVCVLLMQTWAIRLGIALHWSIVFTPLLLGCLLLGYFQREQNKTRYSFTSPFFLSFAIRACYFIFFVGLSALLMPWYVHPWSLPLCICFFSLIAGVVVMKLQKNI